MLEEQSPTSDGKCKAEGCEGRVVKHVAGATSYDYIYHIPACDTCGRQYISAGDVPAVGHEEFQRAMSVPYGL